MLFFNDVKLQWKSFDKLSWKCLYENKIEFIKANHYHKWKVKTQRLQKMKIYSKNSTFLKKTRSKCFIKQFRNLNSFDQNSMNWKVLILQMKRYCINCEVDTLNSNSELMRTKLKINACI